MPSRFRRVPTVSRCFLRAWSRTSASVSPATAFHAASRPAPRSPTTTRTSTCCSSPRTNRSEEHTSELQSPCNLVCRLLLEKKKKHHAALTDALLYPLPLVHAR